MRNYTWALCFVALVAIATTFVSGHATRSYIGTTDMCAAGADDHCSPPERATGNILCKACCAAQGYDKDKSSCCPGSSSSCCCVKD
ncbi:hypothetical protein VPH35_140324 [Triticum aestivum]